jgi:hypothetical protein
MIDNARMPQTIEGLVPILGNNPNVSLVAYEHTYDLEVNRFLEDILKRPDTSHTKFMICNYAVLKNPLAREARDINDLDEMLRGSYADKGILYKWMGYDYLYLIQPVEYHFTRYGPESERSGTVRKRFGLNREVRIGSPAIPYVQSSDKPKKNAKEIMEPVLDITFEGPDPSLGNHYVEPAATMRPRFMPEPTDEPRVESPVRPSVRHHVESTVRLSDSYGPAQ